MPGKLPEHGKFVAGNGLLARISPRVGLETERSDGVGSGTDPCGFVVWNRRRRSGALTSQWWRKYRCGRVKDRSEIPAPVGRKRAGTCGGIALGHVADLHGPGATRNTEPALVAGHRCASYFEENRVFKAGDRLYMLAWNSTVPWAAAGWSRWNGR